MGFRILAVFTKWVTLPWEFPGCYGARMMFSWFRNIWRSLLETKNLQRFPVLKCAIDRLHAEKMIFLMNTVDKQEEVWHTHTHTPEYTHTHTHRSRILANDFFVQAHRIAWLPPPKHQQKLLDAQRTRTMVLCLASNLTSNNLCAIQRRLKGLQQVSSWCETKSVFFVPPKTPLEQRRG